MYGGTYAQCRRTKIVCTIGPSSSDSEVICRLIDAGMNVARINFSHGTHEGHAEVVGRIRYCAADMGRNIAILADLQGPKIRTGLLENGDAVHIGPGDAITITTRDIVGDASIISTSYQALPTDVKPGDAIYITDGLIELVVDKVEETDVRCTVVRGGTLGQHKGINLPGVAVSASSLTAKDHADLEFIMTLDVDFIALSFVRRADDVKALRRYLSSHDSGASIVAKIERPEAVSTFAEILEVTDAIMLARGDLGVEVPLHEVPQIQKRIIKMCNDAGVPVITATQMLESMVATARPTRAEVADVANAVYDGTDALMLSAETASGAYPVEAVQTMARIAEEADMALAQNPSHEKIARMRQNAIRRDELGNPDAIAQAACRTAEAINARRIVCFTRHGLNATLIARYRPTVPITAITLTDLARQRCSVIWGVDALLSIEPVSTDDLDRVVDETLLSNDLADKGDTIVIVGGFPLAMRTRANMIKLHKVGVRSEDY